MDFDSTSNVMKMTRSEMLKAAKKLREDLEDRLEKYLRSDEKIAVYLCPTDDESGPVCVSMMLLAPSRMESGKMIAFYDQTNVYSADIPYEKILESIEQDVGSFLEQEG